MSEQPPVTEPQAETRLTCEQTNGYNVKAGAHYYEWCPFCGHRTNADDSHDIEIQLYN
ncbi:hypothetical protein [Haloferax sp. DFSO60]|uniref:hypothetical protein n=1 Tax=Haloferax sp. DFSO60 TaxID=3388652 RepID=UPI00397BEF3B